MKHSRWKTVATRNDLYQVLSALKESRRKRNEFDEVFVEGIESIKQALASDRVSLRKILFRDFDALSDWGKNLVESGAFPETIRLEKDLFAELSDKVEPSELMITLRYRKTAPEDFVFRKDPLIVVFDRPSDQGNLGSLIRSADAFGVDLFLTHGHCVDLFEPKVIRSSLGAVFHTPVAHVDSFGRLGDWLLKLKEERGVRIIGTDSSGDRSLAEAAIGRPAVLVLGNEAKGMSVRLKSIVDETVRIPLSGTVNSLNVASAGSIMMWEIARNSSR